MPHDPELARRVRALLADAKNVSEKRMFGGVGWTIGGHMATGAHFDGRLVVRCAREDFEAFLAEPGADGMKRNERNLAGWLVIDAEAVAEDEALARWVARGRAYAESLPPKG